MDEHELSDDVLWEGRPVPELVLQRYPLIMLAMWAIQALFGTVAVWLGFKLAIVESDPTTLVFLAGGGLFLYLSVGHLVLAKHKLRHFRYVLTERHAKIFYRGELRDEVDLQKCPTISVRINQLGRGRIVFGDYSPVRFGEFLNSSKKPYTSWKPGPLSRDWPPGPPRFENIDEPERVLGLIERHHQVRIVRGGPW